MCPGIKFPPELPPRKSRGAPSRQSASRSSSFTLAGFGWELSEAASWTVLAGSASASRSSREDRAASYGIPLWTRAREVRSAHRGSSAARRLPCVVAVAPMPPAGYASCSGVAAASRNQRDAALRANQRGPRLVAILGGEFERSEVGARGSHRLEPTGHVAPDSESVRDQTVPETVRSRCQIGWRTIALGRFSPAIEDAARCGLATLTMPSVRSPCDLRTARRQEAPAATR